MDRQLGLLEKLSKFELNRDEWNEISTTHNAQRATDTAKTKEIQKSLSVALHSKSYRIIKSQKQALKYATKYVTKSGENWADEKSSYVYPGPVQYYGPSEVCDQPTRTLLLEKGY